MIMTFTLLLANICIHFQDYVPQRLLSTWQWKIDPWKVTDYSKLSQKIERVNIIRTKAQPVVNEPLSLVCAERTGFFERRVYCSSTGETQWDFMRSKSNEVLLRYSVNAEWNKITLLQDNTKTQGTVAFEYLAQIMPGVCLKHGILTLHCALVEYNGMSIAICAPSGTGKTTHARLWRDYKNALILNGDRALCRREEGRWIAYGSPWSGTSGEQINRHAPLKALVILERAEKNSAIRLESTELFAGVFPHLLYPSWDKRMLELAMDQLEDLLLSVPVYRVKCRPEAEAVDILYQKIWEK